MSEAKTREVIKRAFRAKRVNEKKVNYWEALLVDLNDNTIDWLAARYAKMPNKRLREATRIELTRRSFNHSNPTLFA